MDPSQESLAQIPQGAIPFWMGPEHGWTPQDFDALVIATPWDRHLEYVEAAIACRTPFFIEKPLGSLEQLPRWRAIAQMDLPVNQVGYQCRFHPKAHAMKLLFPDATWGRFRCQCQLSDRYGPFLLEAVSHDLDLALWLGASPTVASVNTQHHDGLMQRAELGQFSVEYAERADYLRLWSVGTWSDLGAEVSFDSPEALGDQMYRDEMAHFLECVRENKPTICPLADGLRVLEVVQQVEALTRQPA